MSETGAPKPTPPQSPQAWRDDWKDTSRTAGRRQRRIGIALTTVALLVLALLMWALFQPVKIPPARLFAIGSSQYSDGLLQPLPLAREDARSLEKQFKAFTKYEPEYFHAGYDLTNNLDSSNFFAELDKQLQSVSDENLIVVCRLHGVVKSASGGIELLTTSATHLSPRSISLSRMMSTLDQSQANRVLLLLDCARLQPDWRLGIVANDCLAQLQSEIGSGANSKFKKLAVIAVSATPQSNRNSSGEQSDFAQQLMAALQGDCDTSGDEIVQVDEMQNFLSSPGLVVSRLGISDFDLMKVPSKIPPADDSEAADTSTAEAAESAGGAESSDDVAENSDRESEPAGEEQPPEQVPSLPDLWDQQQRLLTEPVVVTNHFAALSEISRRLQIAELELRMPESRQRRNLQEIQNLIRAAGSSVGSDVASDLTVALMTPPRPGNGEEPPPPPEFVAFMTALKAAEEEGTAAMPELRTADRLLVAQQLVEDSRQLKVDQVEQVRLAFKRLQQRWPSREWPQELVFVHEFLRRADRICKDADSLTLMQDTLLMMSSGSQRDLLTRLWRRPSLLTPSVKQQISEGLTHLLAGERWLHALGAQEGLAQQCFVAARQSFDAALDDVKSREERLNLEESVALQIPEIAWFVAADAEAAEGYGNLDLRNAAELSEKLEAQFSANIQDGQWFDLRNAWPEWPPRGITTEQEHRSLLEVLLHVRSAATSPTTYNRVNESWRDLLSRLPEMRDRARDEWAFESATPRKGIWHSFWAIAVLQAGGADVADLWTDWRSLCGLIENDEAADKVIDARTALGMKIADRLPALALAGDPIAARMAHPVDLNSFLDSSAIVDLNPGRAKLVAVLAANWRRREADSLWLALANRAEIFAGALPDRATDARPELSGDELTLESGELLLRLDREQKGNLDLALPDAADVQIRLLGPGSRQATVSKEIAPGSYGLEFRQPNREDELFLAVTDAENRLFPHRIWKVALEPGFDPAEWRLQFPNLLTFPPNKSSRESLGKDVQQVIALKLPPGTGDEPVVMLPTIVKPQTSPVSKIAVTIRPRAMNGLRWGDPPIFEAEIMADESGSFPLSLPAAPDAPPAGEAAPTFRDISKGLLVEISPDGDRTKQFRFAIQPEFWSAEQFLGDFAPQPVISADDGIKLTLERRQRPAELLLPKSVPVSLQFWGLPDELLKQGTLSGVLEEGAACDLGIPGDTLLSELLMGNRIVEMSLSVAGIPHAYRWQLGGGRAVLISDPVIRISQEELSDRQMIDLRQEGLGDLRIPVEIDVPYSEGEKTLTWSWRLFRDRRQIQSPPAESFSESDSRKQQAELAIDAEGWKFATTTDDHQLLLRLGSLGPGRYSLAASLRVDGEEVNEYTQQFAADNSDPDDGVLDGVPATHLSAKPMRFSVRAADDESGVARVFVWIDTDHNEQRGPQEPARAFPPRDARTPQTCFDVLSVADTVQFDPSAFEKLDIGSYSVGVEVINGMGWKSSRTPRQFTLQHPAKPNPAQPGVTPPPAFGNLSVMIVEGDKKFNIKFDGPTPISPIMHAFGKKKVHFYEDLASGNYVATWTGRIKGQKAFTIKAGETESVSIP